MDTCSTGQAAGAAEGAVNHILLCMGAAGGVMATAQTWQAELY